MTRVRFEGITMYLLSEAEYEVISAQLGKMLTRADLCKLYGIAKSTLSEKPWLLPNFGIGAKGRRNYKWSEHEVLEWMKTPQEIHKQEYEKRFV